MKTTLNNVNVEINGKNIEAVDTHSKDIVYSYFRADIDPGRRATIYHINGIEFVKKDGQFIKTSDELYVTDTAIYLGITCTLYRKRADGLCLAIAPRGRDDRLYSSLDKLIEAVKSW